MRCVTWRAIYAKPYVRDGHQRGVGRHRAVADCQGAAQVVVVPHADLAAARGEIPVHLYNIYAAHGPAV